MSPVTHADSYDAAGTLITLSSAPSAVAAAAKCYIDLIIKESDNNVKLIVLDRLIRLKENPSNERVLQDLAMDVLRVLAAPDLEVREKTLQLTLDLVSGRNANEIVAFLKKELAKTRYVRSKAQEKAEAPYESACCERQEQNKAYSSDLILGAVGIARPLEHALWLCVCFSPSLSVSLSFLSLP